MFIGDMEYMSQIGAITDKDNRRVEITLENGGRIVVYYPMEGVRLFACDIRCGIKEEVKTLLSNYLPRGHFLRTAVCLSGCCKYKKGDRSGVIHPNYGIVEQRCDDYPLQEFSDEYYGLMTVLYFNKMPKGESMYARLASNAVRSGFSSEKNDALIYFRQSNLTRRAVENLMNMCFSNENQDMILIRAMEVGMRYIDDVSTSNSGYRRMGNKSQIIIAEEIMNCLTERYDESWTIKSFAEKYKISGTTLNKYFLNAYGYEIKEYQTKVRMERAEEMLRDTDYSIGEIAQRVGYATHTKFGTVFKDRYGVTPREFRRRYCIMHLKNQDDNFNG